MTRTREKALPPPMSLPSVRRTADSMGQPVAGDRITPSR